MIRTEGKVPYLCLIVLIFFFALSWTKENKKKMWKSSTAEGKKSHISAGMSTFSSNLCPFAPSCLQQKKKNVFLKNCEKKITPTYLWRYYFLVHASPHLDQKMGIKKSPLSVCLSLFWQPEKKIKHKDKKKHEKKFDISILFVQLPPVRTILHWDVTSTGGGVRLWDADSDCRKG